MAKFYDEEDNQNDERTYENRYQDDKEILKNYIKKGIKPSYIGQNFIEFTFDNKWITLNGFNSKTYHKYVRKYGKGNKNVSS